MWRFNKLACTTLLAKFLTKQEKKSVIISTQRWMFCEFITRISHKAWNLCVPKFSPDLSPKPNRGFFFFLADGPQTLSREKGKGKGRVRVDVEVEGAREVTDGRRDVLALERGWLDPLGWEEGPVLVLCSQRNSLICHHLV